MASASAGEVGRHLRQLFAAGSGVGLDDGQLLERFAAAARRGERDAAEAAFETILARHGATVLSVCRQVLGDGHEADDAFQATFLVLVRRAGSLSVRQGGTLGGWLHGVAYRTALKARRGAARRRTREQRAARPESREGLAVAAVEEADLGEALHAEVARLPAKYRAAVVLCYFEGRTHDEAAAVLNWPVGTVRRRLSLARDLLRRRLIRRGLAPAVAAPIAAGTGMAARAEVPAPLLRATLEVAVRGVPGAAAATAGVVFEGLFWTRWRMATAALSLVAMAAGVAFVLRGAPASPTKPGSPDPPPAAAAGRRPAPVDRFGDPLPEHARARLGTIRFNDGEMLTQVAFARDGRSLFTAGGRRGVQVWDVASGRVVRRIGDGDGDDAQCEIAMAPDGRMLAVHPYSGDRLELRDAATGRELRRWHLAKGGYASRPRFSPDGRTLATVFTPKDVLSQNGELTQAIDLWDLTVPTEHRRRLEGIPYFLMDYQLSPDGRTLALAVFDFYNHRVDASVQLWDVAAGKERLRFPIGEKNLGPLSIAFAPDGRRLFAAVTDQTIRVYDLAGGREVKPPLNHEHALATFPTQYRLPEAVGVLDRTMDCLTFSPDGSILAAAARTTGGIAPAPWYVPEICLWDVARGKVVRHFPAQEELVLSLAFAPDGKTIASTGRDPTIRLRDVATGREASLQAGHRSGIPLVVVSPADGTVFTGGKDGTVRQWDPATGRELGVVADLADEVTGLAIAPDGRALLVLQAGELRLWSIAEGREIRRLTRPGKPFGDAFQATFSPDGSMVAADLGVVNVRTGRVLATFRDRKFADDHLSRYVPMSFSADGRRVISAEAEGARVWDVATGREVRWAVRSRCAVDGLVIAGIGPRATMPAAFSRDGRFLAASGSIFFDGWAKERPDPAIRIWDLASGGEAAALPGQAPTEQVVCLAYSPDGRLLASCSVDRRTARDPAIRLWSVAARREVRRFEGHRGPVNALAFTPDGRSLISAGEDATALVWDVSDPGGR